jgi:hypothetical protein
MLYLAAQPTALVENQAEPMSGMGMRRLRDEAHAKGCADTADCIETRFTAWPEGLV